MLIIDPMLVKGQPDFAQDPPRRRAPRPCTAREWRRCYRRTYRRDIVVATAATLVVTAVLGCGVLAVWSSLASGR